MCERAGILFSLGRSVWFMLHRPLYIECHVPGIPSGCMYRTEKKTRQQQEEETIVSGVITSRTSSFASLLGWKVPSDLLLSSEHLLGCAHKGNASALTPSSTGIFGASKIAAVDCRLLCLRSHLYCIVVSIPSSGRVQYSGVSDRT